MCVCVCERERERERESTCYNTAILQRVPLVLNILFHATKIISLFFFFGFFNAQLYIGFCIGNVNLNQYLFA